MPSSSIYFPWCDFKRLGDLGDYVLIVRLVINHFFFNLNDDDAVIIQTLLNNSHFSSRISFSDTGDPFFFSPLLTPGSAMIVIPDSMEVSQCCGSEGHKY